MNYLTNPLVKEVACRISVVGSWSVYVSKAVKYLFTWRKLCTYNSACFVSLSSSQGFLDALQGRLSVGSLLPLVLLGLIFMIGF